MAEHSERNPFRSLALPIGVRALLAGACAMWLLFRNAQPLFAAPETVLGALVAALVLLARATLDAVLFFKTWVPLPARAVVPMALDQLYKPDDLTTLVVSAISPNQQRYLGRLGQWLSRASTRFSSLPLHYQWLAENGLIILATVFPMAAAVFFVTALAAAGGRPDVAAAARIVPPKSRFVASAAAGAGLRFNAPGTPHRRGLAGRRRGGRSSPAFSWAGSSPCSSRRSSSPSSCVSRGYRIRRISRPSA